MALKMDTYKDCQGGQISYIDKIRDMNDANLEDALSFKNHILKLFGRL